MFVRSKRSRGSEGYYLVENHREYGCVRQKVIAYLGPKWKDYWTKEVPTGCDTIEGAIEYWEARLQEERTRQQELEALLKNRPALMNDLLRRCPYLMRSWKYRAGNLLEREEVERVRNKVKQIKKEKQRIRARLKLLRECKRTKAKQTS